MKVAREPAPPFKLATTLSGRRIHYTVPVQYHSLTLCREVVYEVVTAEQARGRTTCATCEAKVGGRE